MVGRKPNPARAFVQAWDGEIGGQRNWVDGYPVIHWSWAGKALFASSCLEGIWAPRVDLIGDYTHVTI
jgi:hypothetical protein